MKQKDAVRTVSAKEEKARRAVRQIRRQTQRRFSAEETILELCRREGIAPTVYYKWSKAFLEAGKNGLTKDTLRNATSDEVKRLRQENEQLKQSLADAILETQRYKKSFGL